MGISAGAVYQLKLAYKAGVDLMPLLNEGLSHYQMEEIRLGLEAKLDAAKYADPKFPVNIMRYARMCMFEGINIDKYLSGSYNPSQLTSILKALSEGRPVENIDKKSYSGAIMKVINLFSSEGIDLLPYAKKKFNSEQLKQIARGIKSGVDISIFANRKFDAMQMNQIRRALEMGIDCTALLNPDFPSIQMKTIRSMISMGLNIPEFTSTSFSYSNVSKLFSQAIQNKLFLTGPTSENEAWCMSKWVHHNYTPFNEREQLSWDIVKSGKYPRAREKYLEMLKQKLDLNVSILRNYKDLPEEIIAHAMIVSGGRAAQYINFK